MKPTRRSGSTLAIGLIVASLAALFTGVAQAAPGYYCDIDNDGFSDVTVGSPNEDRLVEDDGVVTTFYGSTTGFGRWGTLWLTDPNKGDKVGQITLCADLNGDGFEDLATGVPFRDLSANRTDVGQVIIVYGSSDGLDFGNTATITQATPGVAGKAQSGDNFGREMTWADFNRDGFADLVVSAPGEDLKGARNAGQVHVLYGSATGVLDQSGRARGFVVHQNSRGIRDRAERNDYFGISLITADYDGDGLIDLAVGSPLEDVNGHRDAGAINVIYGDGRGLSTRDQFIHQDRAGMKGEATDLNRFGAPLFASHFIGGTPAHCVNRSCASELIVGVPGENVNGKLDAGAVYILRGTKSGLTGRGGEVWHRGRRGIAGAPTTGEQFGAAVVPGYFDSDAVLDLAVGVPGDNVSGKRRAGSVHILFGDGDGLSRRDFVLTQNSPGIPGRAQRNDRFGSSIAVGDFDGDTWSDLAIGIPRQNVSGASDAGAMVMILGTDPGLAGVGARIYTQNDAPSDQTRGPESGDNFGTFSAPLPGFGGLTASVVGQPRQIAVPWVAGPTGLGTASGGE